MNFSGKEIFNPGPGWGLNGGPQDWEAEILTTLRQPLFYKCRQRHYNKYAQAKYIKFAILRGFIKNHKFYKLKFKVSSKNKKLFVAGTQKIDIHDFHTGQNCACRDARLLDNS